MVDNRGISPVPSFNFKSGDASGMANRMSDEKNGQGGEYFAQEFYEDEQEQENIQYQDRSAQLRASLNGLAAANVGAIHFMKAIKEKEEENSKKKKEKKEELEEEIIEELLDE